MPFKQFCTCPLFTPPIPFWLFDVLERIPQSILITCSCLGWFISAAGTQLLSWCLFAVLLWDMLLPVTFFTAYFLCSASVGENKREYKSGCPELTENCRTANQQGHCFLGLPMLEETRRSPCNCFSLEHSPVGTGTAQTPLQFLCANTCDVGDERWWHSEESIPPSFATC